MAKLKAGRLGRELARYNKYVVHLTRDSDVYVPLKERVNIGRSWRADLFISLHADSSPDADVEGLSIYTLSESGSDKEAAALARKENQSDVIAGVDLAGGNSTVAPILIDLAQRDTMNRSSRFALGAVATLSGRTDILPRRPLRSAAFVVLKAPDVPSVLIELGYLSNKDDVWRIRDPNHWDNWPWREGGGADRLGGWRSLSWESISRWPRSECCKALTAERGYTGRSTSPIASARKPSASTSAMAPL